MIHVLSPLFFGDTYLIDFIYMYQSAILTLFFVDPPSFS